MSSACVTTVEFTLIEWDSNVWQFQSCL